MGAAPGLGRHVARVTLGGLRRRDGRRTHRTALVRSEEWSRCGRGSCDAAEYGGVAQSPPHKTGLGAPGVTQRLEVPVNSQHGLGV